jgi:uncharacterized protein YjbJ (UPF0337 family)
MEREGSEGEGSEGEGSEGRVDEAIGRAKEAVGALTDDDALRREGRADQAAGKAKGKLGEWVDRARDALRSVIGRDAQADDDAPGRRNDG